MCIVICVFLKVFYLWKLGVGWRFLGRKLERGVKYFSYVGMGRG